MPPNDRLAAQNERATYDFQSIQYVYVLNAKGASLSVPSKSVFSFCFFETITSKALNVRKKTLNIATATFGRVSAGIKQVTP